MGRARQGPMAPFDGWFGLTGSALKRSANAFRPAVHAIPGVFGVPAPRDRPVRDGDHDDPVSRVREEV